MSNTGLRFCGNLESSFVTSELPNFKPVSFPPSNDFFVSVKKDGSPLSKYSDNIWDFKAYSGRNFNFEIQQLTIVNNDRLKQLIFLYLYHMPIFPGKIATLGTHFALLSKLCKFADSHNITVDQLYRFPQLATDVMKIFTTSQHITIIMILNQILRSEDILGWKIADSGFIEKLAKLEIPHIRVQNSYIPPRLWMSLVQSSELVLNEFEKNKDAFSEAWIWLSKAYQHNIENGYTYKSPFNDSNRQSNYRLKEERLRHPRLTYPGGAKAFFEDRGLANLLSRWVGYIPNNKDDLSFFSAYANLVRDCSFVFILAHSIQRLGEGLSLRSDSFQVDEDPSLGKVAFLIGETTKTDPDSDARWIIPMKVERAVKVLNYIGRLRLDTTLKPVDPEIIINPYLMTGSLECWGSGTSAINLKNWSLNNFVKNNPIAFPTNEFIITEEDYKIAYQLTPLLKEKSWFVVGKIWSFNTHQLRRTLAVNLFASNIPDSIIQWQMKHKTINQSYYYGRNHTRLRINSYAERTVVIEGYRSIVRNLIEATENTIDDNVHSTGNNLIATSTLKLIEERDHKKLEALAKNGEISARPTLLGFCMTQSCEYGGIESAVHCAGVDGKGPCKDAIFSKRNNKKLKALSDSNAKKLIELSENTPKHSKLKAENEAIEVYFHATS